MERKKSTGTPRPSRKSFKSLLVTEKYRGHAAAILAGLASLVAVAAPARAGLTIVPTWDATITSSASAGTIEASINEAISRVEADVSNSIIVNIYFESMSSGLGESETTAYATDYQSYRSLLANNQTLSPNDNVALTYLPNQVANPVSANAGVFESAPLFRALGQNTPGDLTSTGASGGTFDGVIGVNTSLCNLSRTGTQNASKYDIEGVVGHEMDEVLGIGGVGSSLYLDGTYTGQAPPTDDTGALDLFRYSANGVRSYTLDPTKNAYFSINGGATNFVNFDQNNEGADFADWGNGTPNAEVGNNPPQMQDSFGSPGVDVNIGSNEFAALDVVGYNLTPAALALEATAPEPATCGLFLFAAAGLLARSRRPVVR